MRWFRLRRSGLIRPFESIEETAGRLVGVQSQLAPAAQIAIWNRTQGVSASGIEAARIEKRSLVRFWGQRNTMHTYRAEDWPLVQSALADRASFITRKLKTPADLRSLRALTKRLTVRLEKGQALGYADAKSKALEASYPPQAVAYAAFMLLVREGVVCHGPDRAGRSTFVHRESWMPGLSWRPPKSPEAGAELARRYLAAYGPAEARDLAFWLGGNLSQAKEWIQLAREDCVEVEIAGRSHWMLRADRPALGAQPPAPSRWPVHLLYRFDPLLLATKDKSWLIEEQHYKRVWRAAAHVEPVLLVRGRIAGTWRYDRKAKGVRIRIVAFEPPSRATVRAARSRAEELAKGLESSLESFEVTT